MRSLYRSILKTKTRQRKAGVKKTVRTLRQWDLDTPVIDLTGRGDIISIGGLCQGVQVIGLNGSGKSSASVPAIVRPMLELGAGLLGTTVKVSDCADLRRWSKEAGRLGDVGIFEPGGALRLNLVEYAFGLGREAGSGGTEHVVEVCRIAMRIVDGDGGRDGGEAIWDRARDNLLRNLVDLLVLAREPLSLRNMARLVATAPDDAKAVRDLRRIAREVREGKRTLEGLPYFAYCWIRAAENDFAGSHGLDRHSREATIRYWTSEWPGLPDRTRGSVRFSFDAMVGALLRGNLAELCSTDTTFSLRECLDGMILILNLPVKEYGQGGRIIQALIKHLWQKEMERRSVPPAGDARPLILICDEAHEFLCEEDIRFAATARSARVCALYVTQSVASLRRCLGNDGAETLMGVLQTKVTHACDGVSAEWKSHLIGSDRTYRSTINADGEISFTESVEPLVPPIEFSRLALGGRAFDYVSEAYVFKPGAKWGPDGQNFLKVRFRQR